MSKNNGVIETSTVCGVRGYLDIYSSYCSTVNIVQQWREWWPLSESAHLPPPQVLNT